MLSPCWRTWFWAEDSFFFRSTMWGCDLGMQDKCLKTSRWSVDMESKGCLCCEWPLVVSVAERIFASKNQRWRCNTFRRLGRGLHCIFVMKDWMTISSLPDVLLSDKWAGNLNSNPRYQDCLTQELVYNSGWRSTMRKKGGKGREMLQTTEQNSYLSTHSARHKTH